MKKVIIALLATAFSASAFAQGGTNSPYSQYGLGSINDAATGFSRGMNGLGIGYRSGAQVNSLNPASYSGVDSLTFIFDVGMSGQVTNFEQNGKRLNANNASLEYAVGSFRAARHVGVAFGLVPYSTIGYSYSNSETISPLSQSGVTTYTNTYSGSGGLHQVFLGGGWEPVKGLSVGANFSYLWGNLTHAVVNSYSSNTVNTLTKYYTASVSNYKADFGIQYQLKLTKKDELTVGFVFSPGHKLQSDPKCWVISTNAETSVSDTTTYVVNNGLELPTSFGGGLIWNHSDRLRVGFDYQMQRWGSIAFPVYNVVNDVPRYELSSDYYQNRQKYTFGGEYCANERSQKFFEHLRYRAGVSYATPYLNINGQDGPKELSVSAGFAIPFYDRMRYRSFINISGQWVRQEAKGLIKENTFRINVGITFKERWFAKWKVE